MSEDALLPDPWEQQGDETPQAFAAFRRYRDALEDRAIRKVADELGKSETLISRWSSRHGWVMRVRAYDAHLDAQRRRAQEKAIRDMADRHARLAMAMTGVAAQAMSRLQKRQAEDEEYIALGPEHIRGWLETGVRVERVSRGEPDEIVRGELGAADPVTRSVVTDPDVMEASRELVRRAALAREGKSGRSGPGDKPQLPPAEAS